VVAARARWQAACALVACGLLASVSCKSGKSSSGGGSQAGESWHLVQELHEAAGGLRVRAQLNENSLLLGVGGDRWFRILNQAGEIVRQVTFEGVVQFVAQGSNSSEFLVGIGHPGKDERSLPFLMWVSADSSERKLVLTSSSRPHVVFAEEGTPGQVRVLAYANKYFVEEGLYTQDDSRWIYQPIRRYRMAWDAARVGDKLVIARPYGEDRTSEGAGTGCDETVGGGSCDEDEDV
jgi:hypothetical protein